MSDYSLVIAGGPNSSLPQSAILYCIGHVGWKIHHACHTQPVQLPNAAQSGSMLAMSVISPREKAWRIM